MWFQGTTHVWTADTENRIINMDAIKKVKKVNLSHHILKTILSEDVSVMVNKRSGEGFVEDDQCSSI